MKNSNGSYFTTVIVDTEKDEIIGSASLIIEKKFIHGCALVSLLLTLAFVKNRLLVSYYSNIRNYDCKIVCLS